MDKWVAGLLVGLIVMGAGIYFMLAASTGTYINGLEGVLGIVCIYLSFIIIIICAMPEKRKTKEEIQAIVNSIQKG